MRVVLATCGLMSHSFAFFAPRFCNSRHSRPQKRMTRPINDVSYEMTATAGRAASGEASAIMPCALSPTHYALRWLDRAE